MEQESEAQTSAGGSGRSRHPFRWVAGGLLIVAIALATLLTQSGGNGGEPLNAMARAAEITQREPGGHVAVAGLIVPPTGSKPLPLTGRMVYDGDGRTRGYMSLPNPKGPGRVEFRMAGDATGMYISSEAFGDLPEGASWMKVPVPPDSGSTPSLGANDSAQEGFEMLEEAGDVERVGEETVLGVATTHYRGELAGSLQIEAWIDGRERIRRMTMSSTSSDSDIDLTMDYTDFGEVPPISMPDSSEVFDASSLGAGESD